MCLAEKIKSSITEFMKSTFPSLNCNHYQFKGSGDRSDCFRGGIRMDLLDDLLYRFMQNFIYVQSVKKKYRRSVTLGRCCSSTMYNGYL